MRSWTELSIWRRTQPESNLTQQLNEHFSSGRSIAFRAGGVIDGFHIEENSENQSFGYCPNQCQASIKEEIHLESDETVKSISYGRITASWSTYKNRPCRLSIKTNLQTYGPFSPDFCSESVEIVEIPSGTRLIDFFKSNVKTALVTTGFAGDQYFFDGFISGECIQSCNRVTTLSWRIRRFLK